ncbi:copper chaperone PCu(A)C [Corynebacterium suedekumii]|nr:copper chaperone PCu(A)C [Corynebacterium suedekumii]
MTGFTSDVEGTYEIHEVVDGVMQEKEGGITIPAGGSHEMTPGNDHMMILDHPAEIPAGDVVDLTIELGNGGTLEVEDVAVRTMNPGDEDYGEDGELSGHEPEHDHQRSTMSSLSRRGFSPDCPSPQEGRRWLPAPPMSRTGSWRRGRATPGCRTPSSRSMTCTRRVSPRPCRPTSTSSRSPWRTASTGRA